MSSSPPLPTLFKILFAESALAASHTLSGRILDWAQAFEEWLESRRRPGYRSLYRLACVAWTRLAELNGLPPWSITPADIECYRDWLLEQGLASNTVHNYMASISSFYEWCAQRPFDPHIAPSFNPARDVPHPKIPSYGNAHLLTPKEAAALLDVLKTDDCLLSLRDYAFMLARLRLGVPNKMLRQLKWGQIDVSDGDAWVEWVPGKFKNLLPAEVWQAIHHYLQASGRLGASRAGQMPAGAYIFAPLVENFGIHVTGLAEEWDELRCPNPRYPAEVLKIYGRLAGIDEHKLALPVLRHTAIARFAAIPHRTTDRLAFLCCTSLKRANSHICHIRALQRRQPPSDFEARLPTSPRIRHPYYTPHSNFKHGRYALHLLPSEQLHAIQAEGIVDLKAETQSLITLMRGVMDWLDKTRSNIRATIALSEAHLLSTPKLKILLDFDDEQKDQGLSEGDAWGVELLHTFWRQAYTDEPPGVDIIYAIAEDIYPDLFAGDQFNKETLEFAIAVDRLLLRNFERRALETTDPLEYARLLHFYGAGCLRLCKLLRQARPQQGRIQAYVERLLAQILADERERLGFPRGDDTYYPPRVRKTRSNRHF